MNLVTIPASLPPGSAISSDTLRGANAARDFEAYLIGMLLESVQKTFAGLPGEDSVPGSDDYSYLATRALAQGVADRGGFGIAALISQHLPAHEGKGSGVSNGAPEPALEPKVPPSPADRRR